MNCFVCCLFWIALVIIAIKIYIKLTRRRNGTYTTLVGKTTIVTGANRGIGYTTALDFAMRGARVILACRSKERAEEAREKIIKASENPNVVVKLVDFQSLDSVRRFAKDINETESRLDILVNNAYIGFVGNQKTNDGLHITLQTNHLSPFLLTHLLIDKLKSSAPSRIVNVSSEAAKFATVDANNLNGYPEGWRYKAAFMEYSQTKLCNMFFTKELAKKLDGTGVTTNAVHPGAVKTDFSSDVPAYVKLPIEVIRSLFFLTPEEGAQTNIYAALSKDVEGITGELFDNCRRVEMYENANDVVLAKKVWAKSEEFVKLRNEEKL